jgi:hypothetical protein
MSSNVNRLVFVPFIHNETFAYMAEFIHPDLFNPKPTPRIYMKVNNASALVAQQAANAAKKSTMGTFEKNAQEFGPIAASVIGLTSGAAQAGSTIGKVVDGLESEIKDVANHTVALATTGANELKSAYNTVASGVGTAASAAASYASTGLSAATQAINALV